MNSESYRFISSAKWNSSPVKLSNEKGAVEASNIIATFSDAIKIAKSLNMAIKNMCPECTALIQKALSCEEREAPTIQQHGGIS
jgi:hypothetical protein